MPAYLNPTDDADVTAAILFEGRQFRPTVAVIAYAFVERVPHILLVRHQNGGPFTLPQGEIRKGERVRDAVRRVMFGEVRIRIVPENPSIACRSFFRYSMAKDRRPEGYTEGKALFFPTVEVPDIEVPPIVLVGHNPIVEMRWCRELSGIRHALQDIEREDKREAYEAAIVEELHRAMGVLPEAEKVAS